MARIQILQLPPSGADGEQPFALIVDQCETPPQRYAIGADNRMAPDPLPGEWQEFGKDIGARGVLVTAERVDIVGEESGDGMLVEFDHAALLDTVSTAIRAHLESAAASDEFRKDTERRRQNGTHDAHGSCRQPVENHFHLTETTLDHNRSTVLQEVREKRQRGDR